jgi:hypothetical protein
LDHCVCLNNSFAMQSSKDSVFAVLIGLAWTLPTLYGISRYPIGQIWLALALLCYGAWLWWKPWWAFFALPALAAALDLSPRAGTLLLNEFDLFALVTFAALYPRLLNVRPSPWPSRLLPIALVALWLSWALASARGLLPLPDLSNGVLDSSHSPLEAWLAGKGMLWALLWIPLMRRASRLYSGSLRRLTLRGLLAGLAVVTLAAIWERAAFVGLWDFDNAFKVTGTFSDMRTGGAYIEAFIALAFPALALETISARGWIWRAIGLAAAAVVCYAMLLAWSGGGYAGLIVGLIVTLPLSSLSTPNGAPTRRWPIYAGLAVTTVAIPAAVFSGDFANFRLERYIEAPSKLEAHWRRVLELMDDGAFTALFGMGFGQYPMRYAFLSDSDQPTGAYAVMYHENNHFLRLNAGENASLDQRVAVEPGARYAFSAWIRQPEQNASLNISLCKKALLYSAGCEWRTLQTKSSLRWDMQNLDLGPIEPDGGWPGRPVKLSLRNPGPGVIDVDNLSLKTEDGEQLLANGSFAEGAKRWLFVTDQNPAWHIHQQGVEIYFAQGWLGLAAFTFLLIGVAKSLRSALAAGDAEAAAWAGALAGFLTVGLLGSTMDEARLSMLFYLAAFCAGLRGARAITRQTPIPKFAQPEQKPQDANGFNRAFPSPEDEP